MILYVKGCGIRKKEGTALLESSVLCVVLKTTTTTKTTSNCGGHGVLNMVLILSEVSCQEPEFHFFFLFFPEFIS